MKFVCGSVNFYTLFILQNGPKYTVLLLLLLLEPFD